MAFQTFYSLDQVSDQRCTRYRSEPCLARFAYEQRYVRVRVRPRAVIAQYRAALGTPDRRLRPFVDSAPDARVRNSYGHGYRTASAGAGAL